MNKKIIFLDWDGTICWSRFWKNSIKSDDKFARIVNDFFVSEKEIVNKWMRGVIRSEYVSRVISRRTGVYYTKVWKEFVSSCEEMEIDQDIVSLIRKVREKHRVVLITGNMDCFTRFTVPTLKLKNIFDDIMNSADVGYLKTDYNGKAFINFTKEFGISMSNAYLLDDSGKTCKIFSRLGGNSIKINSKKDTINSLKMFYGNKEEKDL